MDENDPTREARELINEALHRLNWSADILRGPDVPPSKDAMHLEMAVTRAIETLRAAISKR